MKGVLDTGTSALLGGAVWVVLAVAGFAGFFAIGLLPLLFLLAPLVVVPLGLTVSRSTSIAGEEGTAFRLACEFQPMGALLAAISFFLPTGRVAGAVAAGWLAICLLLAVSGLARILAGALRTVRGACVAISLLYVSIGGAWLVASRLGISPMGFTEPIVLLTAVHFHYAGFAAPLMVAALRSNRRFSIGVKSFIFRFVALLVLAGPGMLAAGFVIGPKMKLAAALAVALGESGIALCTLVSLRSVPYGTARALLAVSSASAVLGMVLAGMWAVGEYPMQPFLDLARMVHIHGTVNSMGFVVCGLLGWLLALRAEPTVSAR